MYGDPVLKRKAREIEFGSPEVVELARDLFETMEEASGIGLAAPQIGKRGCSDRASGCGKK